MDKCPYCEGNCDECPIKERHKEAKKREEESIREALRKEFRKEMLEWTLIDARIKER